MGEFFFKKKSENQSKIRIWTGLHPLAVPPLPDPAACLPPPDGAADRPGHCPHRGGPGHRLPGRPRLQGHLVRRSGEEEAVGAGGVSAYRDAVAVIVSPAFGILLLIMLFLCVVDDNNVVVVVVATASAITTTTTSVLVVVVAAVSMPLLYVYVQCKFSQSLV